MIQIGSVDPPLNRAALLGPAVGLVRRASALGLLRDSDPIETLDLDLLRGIAREAASEGIGQDAALDLVEGASPSRLGSAIQRLDHALIESPLPGREFKELGSIFDVEQLAGLIGVAGVTLRRYAAGVRTVPDAVAARVHWLALVVADLAGSYNTVGLRRWFERPRAQLADRSPRQILTGDWAPDDADVVRVRVLAAALVGAGAAG